MNGWMDELWVDPHHIGWTGPDFIQEDLCYVSSPPCLTPGPDVNRYRLGTFASSRYSAVVVPLRQIAYDARVSFEPCNDGTASPQRHE